MNWARRFPIPMFGSAPWNHPQCRLWRDTWDPNYYSTLSGWRLGGGKRLTIPHKSDLNVTTGLTVELIAKAVNNAATSAYADVTFLTKGSYSTAWAITGGAAAANVSSGRMWVNAGQIATPSYGVLQQWNRLLTRYNAGTVTIRRDNTNETLTGSVGATLPTNSTDIKLGVGTDFFSSYKNWDALIIGIRMWNRSLSDAEADELWIDKYTFKPYSQFSAGLKSGLLRCYEQGDYTCKHTGEVVTQSGGVAIEQTLVSLLDKSGNGRHLYFGMGEGPALEVSPFFPNNCLVAHFNSQQMGVMTTADLLNTSTGETHIAHHGSDYGATERFFLSSEAADIADLQYALIGWSAKQSLPAGFNPPDGSHIPYIRLNNGGGGNNFGGVYSDGLYYDADNPYIDRWRADGTEWTYTQNGSFNNNIAYSVPAIADDWCDVVTDQARSYMGGLGVAAGTLGQSPLSNHAFACQAVFGEALPLALSDAIQQMINARCGGVY